MSEIIKTKSLIGFATKAGKITFGTELTVGTVRKKGKKRVFLMLCASDAAPNTQKRAYDCGAYYDIPVKTLMLTVAELSAITGKSHPIAVIGIIDPGFAEAISRALETDISSPND
ncbi:MAG: ribosomal L7Ae/L30e/S12e/Gadd45 family protein [Clostridia bacterium]|nr:ribosomal L7Ae/L30e/S12e/Gadd45 family protein [Clostridia bacterium]